MRKKNPTQVELLIERRRVRLNSKSSSQRLRLSRVERAWKKYAHSEITMSDLLLTKDIVRLVDQKADLYWKNWRNRRLTLEDFLSELWEEAWDVCGNYTWHGEFYLYETLRLALDRRATSVVRAATRIKRMSWSTALPLADGFENFYADQRRLVEDDVTDHIVIHEMMQHETLSERECRLLMAVYENLDASLQELAEIVGLSNKMMAHRVRESIRTKLDNYNPFGDGVA